MAQTSYRTAPVPSPNMPGGIPYIIGNEAAERFSFYGMKSILVVFMTKYLLDRSGNLATMSEPEAKAWFHYFVATVYFLPILGSLLADVWFGKYRTIVLLSVVYCLGHVALAVDSTRLGLFLGLGLIALGSGGIKPCVSAHVGDQFGRANVHLQEKAFGWFYLSINAGSFFSPLLIPWLLLGFPAMLAENFPAERLAFLGPLDRLGPHLAFGVPGVLMFVATLVFWLGRYEYVHIPARGWKEIRPLLRGEKLWALARLVPICACVAVFWCVYDQTGSSWILQAENMDRRWLGIDWYSEQIQAINPLLILIFVPLFTYQIYPAINAIFPLTALRKVSIGLFLTVISSAIVAMAQNLIDADEKPSIVWQVAAYVVITAAEVMVWVTCLEFSYSQAPRELKSFVMAIYLLSISAGNLLTALVNELIAQFDRNSRLAGANYFWFFTALMLAAAVVFVFVARSYKVQTYLQDEGSDPAAPLAEKQEA
jgi:proton-dependent oligopeptide transporter, POT family